VTKDRLVVKLVNTNPHEIQAQLSLPSIPDGHAHIEYLHSDDLNATNRINFHGVPEYLIVPKEMEIAVQNNSTVLSLKPNGFYVLFAKR
jgi:hypothetical protein